MTSLSKRSRAGACGAGEYGLETPLRGKCWIAKRASAASKSMTEIMQLLVSICPTTAAAETHRIAKMYVDEIFSGLDYANFPKITVIEEQNEGG